MLRISDGGGGAANKFPQKARKKGEEEAKAGIFRTNYERASCEIRIIK